MLAITETVGEAIVGAVLLVIGAILFAVLVYRTANEIEEADE